MDLNQLSSKKKATDGVKMTVTHPQSGEPLIDETTGKPVTITVIGADSDDYKKVQHAHANERLKKAARDGKLKLTAEGIESDAMDLLVKCTKGWEGICLGTDEEGNPLPLKFSEENARKLYETVPFLRDQVAEFMNERGNFLGN